ncbi:hypothetical protein RJK31_004328 [Salmonella enterica]|nr:hypothetical protein [Salmonella enterica]ELC4946909.1 hypothetical protein [Salmonella enterica]
MKKEIIEQWIKEEGNDNPVARAELTRFLVKTVYDFVKFNRPEGERLDGSDGPERRSLADIVDAAENHFSAMLEEKHKDKLPKR